MMRIKGMSPAVQAALFPPKLERDREERSLAEDLAEQSAPPTPVLLVTRQAPQSQLPPPLPERVSLVGVLRQKHAEENRAAMAFDAIRLGHTPPPGGLFGTTSESTSADGEGGGFDPLRPEIGLNDPTTGIGVSNLIRPVVFDTAKSIAAPLFRQPNPPGFWAPSDGNQGQVVLPNFSHQIIPSIAGQAIRPKDIGLEARISSDTNQPQPEQSGIAPSNQPLDQISAPKTQTTEDINLSLELYDMAANHRDDFAKLNLSSYPNLSEGQLKTFRDMQSSIADKTYAENLSYLHNLVTNSLRGFGVERGGSNSEERKIYARDHNALLAGLMRESAAWRAANGTLPGKRTLIAMRDRLLPSLPVRIVPGQRVDQKGFRTFAVPDISHYPDIDLTPEQESAIIGQMKLVPPKTRGWEWSTSRVDGKFTPFQTLKQSHASKIDGAGDVSGHNHTGGDAGIDSEDWEAGFLPGPGDHIPVALNKKPVVYLTPDRKMLVVIGIRAGKFFARPFWWDGDPRKAHVSAEVYRKWKPSGKDKP